MIAATECAETGLALGVFKAAQLLEMDELDEAFGDFTAIDLETTDDDTTKAEIVQIAAVRVRGGQIADTFEAVVRPRVPIAPGATQTHGLSDADVASAPYFEEVWPRFREFCGDDVLVAHNGYDFDFRILQRMVRAIGPDERFGMHTYDTLPLARDLFPTSRKLVDLARQFGIPAGRSHQALDDSRTLASVVLALDREKSCRARKTALVQRPRPTRRRVGVERSPIILARSADVLRDLSRVLARPIQHVPRELRARAGRATSRSRPSTR